MNGASVYQRKNSKKWYVSYFCLRRRKRVHEATPWSVDDPAGRKHALRYATEQAAKSVMLGRQGKHEMWEAWVDKFLDDRYRASKKTHQRMAGAWDWLRVYLDEKEIAVPAALNYNDVIGYVDWRSAQKRHCGKLISRNTALLDIRVLGIIMREATRRGFATMNPCDRLGLKRDPTRERPEITTDEIAKIRSALALREEHLPITERWMTVCFEIAIHQGCRLSETQVPMPSVSDTSIQFVAKGRNGQPHIFTTALHPGLLPIIGDLRAAHAEITCRHPPMAAKKWHDFFAEIGLGHICFHCTRVTVITRLARAGVPIQQAMRFVGHASEAVHKIYQRLKADDLSACVAALGALSAGTAATPQTPGASSAMP